MKEALLYEKLDGGRVRCALCAHRCLIADGKRGTCQVRENREGTLYSLVYRRLISQAIDPIEKKPLFHFYPGSTALSIATVGCNFRCTFCQNADISQLPRDRGRIQGRDVSPEAIIEAAQRHRVRSIAYTYTEPTNGYMSPEMLEMVTSPDDPPLIDAANVDLKAFRDAFYRQQCGATLQPVLDSLRTMKDRGVWLEVTTLIIPGLNDSDEELGDIAQFVATELGVETPWHVSRFHPTYKLTDRAPTPVDTLHRARQIGIAAGLRYVYEGNVFSDGGEDTLCPQCGEVVIRRTGFVVSSRHVREGACAYCGTKLDGVGL